MNSNLQAILCKKIIQKAIESLLKDEELQVFWLKNPKKWENKNFEELAQIADLDSQFLKRLFGYLKIKTFEISKENREKIIAFLKYSSWEVLENELILRASLEMIIDKCLKDT